MAARIPFTRLGPFAASCALHVVLVGLAAAVVPGWVTPLPPVLEAQLIEPEPVPVTPAPPAARPARPAQPAPTTPPRLVEAPKPRVEEPPAMEPPSLPAPAPSVAPLSPPSAPREPLPFAVAASEPAAAPAELPAAVGRPATPAAAPVPPPAGGEGAARRGHHAYGDAHRRLSGPAVLSVHGAPARRRGHDAAARLCRRDGRVTDVQRGADPPAIPISIAPPPRRCAAGNSSPARRGSEPVGMWVRLPVQFVLK